jgi:hypothetical protein
MRRTPRRVRRNSVARMESLERRELLTVTLVGDRIPAQGGGGFGMDASGRVAIARSGSVDFYSPELEFVRTSPFADCGNIQPKVTATLDAGFLVVCETGFAPAFERADIVGRWYTPDGLPTGPAEVLNDVTARPQLRATGGADATGKATVVWFSDNTNNRSPLSTKSFYNDGRRSSAEIVHDQQNRFPIATVGLNNALAIAGRGMLERYSPARDHLGSSFLSNCTFPEAASTSPDGSVFVSCRTLDDTRVYALDDSGELLSTFIFDDTSGSDLITLPRQGALAALPGKLVEFDAAGEVVDEVMLSSAALGIRPDGTGVAFTGSSFQRFLVLDQVGASLPVRGRITAEAQPFANGDRLIQQPEALTVEFVGTLSTSDGTIGEHSATNVANWRLTRNGDDVSSLIASIDVEPREGGYGDGAIVQFTEALPEGLYELIALDAIHNDAGVPIDGDYNGPGGDFHLEFSILLPAAVGDEYQVNQRQQGDQRSSPPVLANTAMRADGTYVTTWSSDGQDGSGWGIYARLFDAQSRPLTNEFRVNQFTAGHQRHSTVAMDDDGNFIVAWQSEGQDGDGYGVYARRFDAAGQAIANEFRVNNMTADYQGQAVVAMDDDGDFVVGWTSKAQDGFGDGVFVRNYNHLGTALTGEIQVNQHVLSDQRLPSVAMDRGGDFIVSWSSFGQDGSGYGVYARRYSSDAQPLVDEFRVNTVTAGAQRLSKVDIDRTGAFMIVWMSNGQDGDGYGIYAQRFDRAGVAAGSEFRVNGTTAGDQLYPMLARDDDGDTVIAWGSEQDAGQDFNVYARRYSPAGVAQGDEFRVNTITAGFQNVPSVAMDADGDFVALWNSESAGTDAFDVKAQRFSANAPPDAHAGGPYLIAEGESLALSAANTTDPDQGDVLTYAWDINGDGNFSDAAGITPTLTWQQLIALGFTDGSAVFDTIRVRATDLAGNVGESENVSLTIENTAPTIALDGAATANEGVPYTLTLGAITDPGVDTVTEWIVHWGDGLSDVYTSGGAKTHVYADGPSAYTITVDLKDEDGEHDDRGTKSVTVNNRAPQLTAVTAADIDENDVALLRGTIVETGLLDALELTIFWGDGSAPEVISLPAGTTTFEIPHRYLDDAGGPAPTQFPIDLLLRDDDGGQDTESIRVTVRNVAPEVTIDGLLAENPVGEIVALSSTVFDPGTLDFFTYQWTVELNGVLYATSTTPDLSFTPAVEANYLVRLLVRDDEGATTIASVTVRVPGGALDGDTNGDGVVDLTDLNNVRNNFGGAGVGDTNGDGIVDLVDLNAVRNNFGAGSAPPITSAFHAEPRKTSARQDRLAIDAVFALHAMGEQFATRKMRR